MKHTKKSKIQIYTIKDPRRDPRLSDVEKDTRTMGIVNWRHVAQDRDGWRRATREALVYLGQWSHRSSRRRRKRRRTTTSQEIPHIIWYPKVHYRVHRSQPHVANLNQIHSVHTTASYFFIHFNNIIPSMAEHSKRPRSFRFSNQHPISISHLFHACHTPCPYYSPYWTPHNNIW
jgi:hypothetical protein